MNGVETITFPSGDATCAAWYFAATTNSFAGTRGRPCVVMAHGFSGTRDSGLVSFATGLADGGLDVLLFDYRGFGDSSGGPRQLVSYRRQRADYLAALEAARSIPEVDSQRLVLWGTSYSGGHVLAAAADRSDVAAVIAMTPFVDGLATLRHLATMTGVVSVARLAGAGLLDAAGALVGREPRMIPAAGAAGSGAVMARNGAREAMESFGSPTWRNEVAARVNLEIAANRPIRFAERLRAPLLVQVGEHDTVVPIAAGVAAAVRAGAGAQVLRYPVDHFDVYTSPWQPRLLEDQLDFLSRQLPPGSE